MIIRYFQNQLYNCFIAIILILFFSEYSLLYAKEARGVTNNQIKIGVIIDLTGPISNAGVIIVKAYKNLLKSINDNGGIHGRKIKLIIEDDHYSIPAGIAGFKKLVFKDKVLAILGPISIGEVKVLFRHIAKHKIPTMPWAPDRAVMNPYKRYVFPTNGFYDNEWGVLFDYIVNNIKPNKQKIALCYPDVESGKVVKGSAEKWAKSYGIKLHKEIIPLSAIDVTSQVLGMRRVGTEVILLHHVAPGAAAVLRDLKKFGLNIPLLGTSAACTEDVIRIGGKATKNFIGASPYSSWHEETPGMSRVRKISMKYNPDDIESYKIKSYTLGWTVFEILHEGLKRSGRSLNGENLVKALESIQNFDTQGLCGPITYTSKKHYGLNYNKLFKSEPESKRLIPITKWKLPPKIR